MKMKINFEYNICSEYDKELFFSIEEIEETLPKICENLLKIKEVKQNACFYSLAFDTLSFDILFVDDEKIKEVNAEYRKIDRPTDVITFALFADDEDKIVLAGGIYLGEILVSVDTARKQATGSVKNEILTLITHGLLHLFGFDHQTEEDYNFVVKVQEKVLSSL